MFSKHDTRPRPETALHCEHYPPAHATSIDKKEKMKAPACLLVIGTAMYIYHDDTSDMMLAYPMKNSKVGALRYIPSGLSACGSL